MLKHAVHYRGVIQVPLLIKAPGTDSGKTQSMASLLDMGQTILELTGCPAYQGMQGHSICPILKVPTISVRDRVLVEERMPVDVTGQERAYGLRTLVYRKGPTHSLRRV